VQEFLARNRTHVKQRIDAKKNRLSKSGALNLARQVDQIFASRGKQVYSYDRRKGPLDEASLLAAILGPTGFVRAPAVRIGRTLIVGFHEPTYANVLRKFK
jgi:arsenate reductase-like glutaredoxin family protein